MRSEVWRTGVREDFGHGQSFPVVISGGDTHDAAVQVDVFRVACIACLDKFLSNGALPFPVQFACQESCGITLACIRIDAADKIHILFHTSFV